MHAVRFLSRWLQWRSVIKHRNRSAALVKVVAALLIGARLSLTQLARRRCGSAYPKHHIKAVDRLLGNGALHRERDCVYSAIAESVLLGTERPVIVVDWSDCEPGRRWVTLKAATPIGGRALTLYERVYPFNRYNSPGAHREFLRALQAVLPERCRPIIVTDAGFRGPWFRDVESYGWDWIGRIRNRVKYYNEATQRWCYTDSLYEQATSSTRHLGEVTLARRHGYRVRLYLVRAHKPRVGRPRNRGGKKPNTGMYRRLHRAPWLLGTSLAHERGSERRVKQLYAQRMQIEETFRDLKSHRFGFGLRYARSGEARRLEVLLLVGSLATILLWLVGLCGVTVRRPAS
jgi:hypothetical protein